MASQALDPAEKAGSQSAIDCYLLLRRSHDRLARLVDSELSQHQTTAAQYGVLVNLLRMQPCSHSELSAMLFRTSGNTTSLIDRMEADGLVERQDHPDDRRVTLIRLTTRGEGLIRALRPRHRRFLTGMLDCYSEGELEVLHRLLAKLDSKLRELMEA